MTTYLYLSFIALISTFFSLIYLRRFAVKIGLTDKPNERKKHLGHIPLIGGVSMYIGVLFSVLSAIYFVPLETHEFSIYLLASLLMVIVGILDDRFDLSVRSRLAVQIFIACIMMFVAKYVIVDLGDLVYLGNINLGAFGYPFTIIAVLGAINAYNMVDGIDGLIGGVSAASFSSLSVLFFMAGDFEHAILCLFFLASLIPYLIFNLGFFTSTKNKIFMGDAGSMFIGFSIVWLLACGSQVSPDLSNDRNSFDPVVALWVVAFPLIDMASIMLRRIKKGTSPFKPDRDHLHHIFMRAGFSPRSTLVIITISAFLLCFIGVVATIFSVPEWLQLIAFLGLFFVYQKALTHIWILLKHHNAMKAKRDLILNKLWS